MEIWKYVLTITNTQQLQLPKGAQFISVANQNGNLCVWAMVNPAAPTEERCIEIIGTGYYVAGGDGLNRRFIGTALVGLGVCHVFELTLQDVLPAEQGN